MNEQTTLKLSVWVAIFFAVFGIVWGVLISSGMIIFDGLYSLLSVALSSLSLVVYRQLQNSADSDYFPFGKAHFEPLLVVFKSLVLVGMCGFSAANAVADILAGGRSVSAGSALVYAVVSTVGCIVVAIVVQRVNKRVHSDLLDAERNQWMGDSVLSVAVLLGFSAALLIEGTSLAWLIPYTDPGMVIVASLFFILFPLKNLVRSAREVIFYRVKGDLLAPVRSVAEEIARELGAEYRLRMVSLGRELSIELNLCLPEAEFSVAEMDAMRDRVAAVVEDMGKQHWINIGITRDARWL